MSSSSMRHPSLPEPYAVPQQAEARSDPKAHPSITGPGAGARDLRHHHHVTKPEAMAAAATQ
jgi:hypothetical protein